jgi:hypothetical protein
LFILVNYRYNKKNILSKIRVSKTLYKFRSRDSHFLRVLRYRSSLHVGHDHLTNDFAKLKAFNLGLIRTTSLHSTWHLYFLTQLRFIGNTKWHQMKMLSGCALLSDGSHDLELSFYAMSFANRSGYLVTSRDKNPHDNLYDLIRPKRLHNFIGQESFISVLHF